MTCERIRLSVSSFAPAATDCGSLCTQNKDCFLPDALLVLLLLLLLLLLPPRVAAALWWGLLRGLRVFVIDADAEEADDIVGAAVAAPRAGTISGAEAGIVAVVAGAE